MLLNYQNINLKSEIFCVKRTIRVWKFLLKHYMATKLLQHFLKHPWDWRHFKGCSNQHWPFMNSSWSIGSSSSSAFGTTRGNNQTVNPKSSSAFTESPVTTHTGLLHGLRDQAALVFDGQQMNEFFLFLLLHLPGHLLILLHRLLGLALFGMRWSATRDQRRNNDQRMTV